ncbi:hypothetical protein CKO39_18525 [Rhodopseudomonas palustris]|nr:hypothetical protein CKO39_18525 [Rhodopseudomonas palustris]
MDFGEPTEWANRHDRRHPLNATSCFGRIEQRKLPVFPVGYVNDLHAIGDRCHPTALCQE